MNVKALPVYENLKNTSVILPVSCEFQFCFILFYRIYFTIIIWNVLRGFFFNSSLLRRIDSCAFYKCSGDAKGFILLQLCHGLGWI